MGFQQKWWAKSRLVAPILPFLVLIRLVGAQVKLPPSILPPTCFCSTIRILSMLSPFFTRFPHFAEFNIHNAMHQIGRHLQCNTTCCRRGSHKIADDLRTYRCDSDDESAATCPPHGPTGANPGTDNMVEVGALPINSSRHQVPTGKANVVADALSKVRRKMLGTQWVIWLQQ